MAATLSRGRNREGNLDGQSGNDEFALEVGHPAIDVRVGQSASNAVESLDLRRVDARLCGQSNLFIRVHFVATLDFELFLIGRRRERLGIVQNGQQ